MDHSSTERTSTAESEAGTSSIDVSSDPLQLNNICSANVSVQPTQAAEEALESTSCNKSLMKQGDQGDLSSRVDNGPAAAVAASTSKGGGGATPSGSPALPESLKYPRKSLPLLPRMNQYERHSLLQVRPGTGLSEFELFLLEKDLFKKKRCSVDDQHSSDSNAAADADATGGAAEPGGGASCTSSQCAASSIPTRGTVRVEEERRLIPRSAHYEPHPLLRKSLSGVCELELYLMEKEEEVTRRQRGDRDRDRDYEDNEDDDDQPTQKRLQGRSKLEPRLNQWEKHGLLEVKDKSGLSQIERLFLETEQQQQQQERGKCGAECVCKSATCKRCKKQQQQHEALIQSPTSSPQQQTLEAVSPVGWKGDSSKTSEDSSSAASAPAGPLLLLSQKGPSGQQKRVHFERQKNDADDSGIASSDASCPAATRQDDVSAPEVSSRGNSCNATYSSKQQKDGEEIGATEETMTSVGGEDRKNRRAFRTDKQQSGKKSCCMS